LAGAWPSPRRLVNAAMALALPPHSCETAIFSPTDDTALRRSLETSRVESPASSSVCRTAASRAALVRIDSSRRWSMIPNILATSRLLPTIPTTSRLEARGSMWAGGRLGLH
jgi:hypothetical protein